MNNLINKELIDDLKNILAADDIKINEPMKNHTYFKIGGNVDLLLIPANVDQLLEAVKLLQKHGEKPIVIGNGTNLLVSDKGIRGVVIKISKKMSNIAVEGDKILADSGCLLSQIASKALENALEGFEFAGGIPGSLGGAIAMNAGAYDGEMKDVIDSVVCMNKEGEMFELSNEKLKFSYRHSAIQAEDLIVLQAKIKLQKGDAAAIKAKIDDFAERRITKQPLNMPSAGSTFKRPIGDYASRLIEANGLKGLRYGDAQVSEKHCGFIVNVGEAKCQDVMRLISVIQKTVKDQSGIELCPEVKIIGEI